MSLNAFSDDERADTETAAAPRPRLTDRSGDSNGMCKPSVRAGGERVGGSHNGRESVACDNSDGEMGDAKTGDTDAETVVGFDGRGGASSPEEVAMISDSADWDSTRGGAARVGPSHPNSASFVGLADAAATAVGKRKVEDRGAEEECGVHAVRPRVVLAEAELPTAAEENRVGDSCPEIVTKADNLARAADSHRSSPARAGSEEAAHTPTSVLAAAGNTVAAVTSAATDADMLETDEKTAVAIKGLLEGRAPPQHDNL